MIRYLIPLAALLVTTLSAPAYADPQGELEREGVRIYKLLPAPSKLIAEPGAKSWSIYGADIRTRDDDAVPGDTVQIIKVPKVGENPWDIGANAVTGLPTKAGDTLVAVVWARATKMPRGAKTVRLPLQIQQQGGDYETFGYTEAELTGDWAQYYVHARLPRDFRQEDVGASVHLATGKQTVELGPVYIMNIGAAAIDPSALPGVGPAAPVAATPVASSDASDGGALSPAIQRDVDALMAKLPGDPRRISPMDFDRAGVYGEMFKHRIVSDAGVPGGKALEIDVEKAGLESWSTGVNWPISEPVRKGDTVLVAVWAKGISAQNESQTPAISPIRLQRSGEDYASAASGAAFLSRDWKLYYVGGTSDVDIAPGPAGISMHLGSTKQKLRIGPTYVFNLGQGVSARDLPINEVTYDGRAADAPWRRAAMARIDEHRRADLRVQVTDAAGAPIANAPVTVRQTAHAFKLGTFVGHSYGDPTTSDERGLRKIQDESFNLLTLPTYWADWGWNGSGSLEADYRDMIDYVAAQGKDWRAHPIVWPGEGNMPSRILDAPKSKRRKLVMDHVREVMQFVAAREPMAIDLVNEPRVNRFFKENGQPDMVEDVFQLAHEIAPEVPLFVNDYAILNNGGLNTKAIEYYHDWLREMRGKRVPVGGIGFQSHFSAGLTAPERVIDILEGFATYDLPLHITEFDVETLDESAQADYTRDFILASLSVPQVEAFVFWQFWEGDHWKPNAAMIRRDWTPKPAYTAYRDLVYRDLWTDETLITDANGYVSLRPMKGEFTVSANGSSEIVTVSGPTEVALRSR